MKSIDVKTRNEKHLKSLVTKMQADPKKNKCIGLTFASIDDNIYTVSIENGLGKHANTMESIIDESPIAILISSEEHEGVFDWKSDMYIKPTSEVTFKM